MQPVAHKNYVPSGVTHAKACMRGQRSITAEALTRQFDHTDEVCQPNRQPTQTAVQQVSMAQSRVYVQGLQLLYAAAATTAARR